MASVFKKGRDYVYMVTPTILKEEEEVSIYKNKIVEVKTLKTDKISQYFRIKVLDKKASVKVLPNTLVITISNRKLSNKMTLNLISQNISMSEYSFGKNGLIVFGKVCTEANI